MSEFTYETLRAGTNKNDSDSGAEVARKFNDNFQKVLDMFKSLEESLTKINESLNSGSGISDIVVSEDNELIITFNDGTTKNLGVVVGSDGAVYVPHVSENKILTFTIEDEPTSVPDPVDLNPNDEWSEIDDSEAKTDYIWNTL